MYHGMRDPHGEHSRAVTARVRGLESVIEHPIEPRARTEPNEHALPFSEVIASLKCLFAVWVRLRANINRSDGECGKSQPTIKICITELNRPCSG